MQPRLIVLATLVLALGLSACGDKEAGAAAGRGPGAGGPPVVTVANPLIKPIVDWDDYVGRFEARQSVEVRPRVSGYVARIAFRDGEFARAGDLLLRHRSAPVRCGTGAGQGRKRSGLAPPPIWRAAILAAPTTLLERKCRQPRGIRHRQGDAGAGRCGAGRGRSHRCGAGARCQLHPRYRADRRAPF